MHTCWKALLVVKAMTSPGAFPAQNPNACYRRCTRAQWLRAKRHKKSVSNYHVNDIYPFFASITWQRVKASLSAGERETPLLGTSGTVWGTALVPKEEDRRGTKKPGSCGVVTNPVFVSIGHRVSLETCVALTKAVGRCEGFLVVAFSLTMFILLDGVAGGDVN